MRTNLQDLAADVSELDKLFTVAALEVLELKAALTRAKEAESYYYRLRSQLADLLELRSLLDSEDGLEVSLGRKNREIPL